jgi:hypothetical protein
MKDRGFYHLNLSPKERRTATKPKLLAVDGVFYLKPELSGKVERVVKLSYIGSQLI